MVQLEVQKTIENIKSRMSLTAQLFLNLLSSTRDDSLGLVVLQKVHFPFKFLGKVKTLLSSPNFQPLKRIRNPSHIS